MDANRNNASETMPPRRNPRRGPMRVVEKPKDFKGAAIRFAGLLKPFAPACIAAFVLSAAGAICSILGPDRLREITKVIFAGITTKVDMAAVGRIALFLVVLYGIGALCSYAQGFIMATVTQKFTRGLRSEISDKINCLPLKYFDRVSFGDVLSRMSNDVDTLGQSLSMSVGQLTIAATLFIGSLLMMLITSPIMTLAAVLSTMLGFAIMMVIVVKSQKYFKAQQQELGRINGHIEEVYSGLNIVRAYNGEYTSEETFKEINEELCKSSKKAQFISGVMMPLMGFVGNLGYVAVCVVGGALVLSGKMGFEVIIAFVLYIRLFSQPLTQLAQAVTMLQTAAAAAERVFEFLDEEELSPDKEGAKETHDSKGEVEFRNVSFGYLPDKPVIKDFSAHVYPGQHIAIVGPTGSGKTTLIQLLMRFYELDKGDILLDGVSIKDMTRKCIHDQFGMVLQDTWLFEGSIRENIVYGRKDVSDEKVIEACKAAGIDHYIRTLPQGYNTILSDSAGLSAGQKQLLTIARAIIENAPLLILDEATSSVDTRTEVQIQRAMEKLTEGRTSFIIAHRLSTIKSADLILVMKDGCILESGNHEELLAKGGFYGELWNSQFED